MSEKSLPFFSSDEIKRAVPMSEAMRVVEDAFIDVSNGHVQMPPKIYLDLPQYSGDFRAMPVYSDTINLAGIKWVNSHTQNARYGKPAVMATMILNNPQTGEPLAVLDAGELTAIRTGAAGGIAIKALANPGPSSVCFIGTGKQAYYQALALFEVYTPNTIHLYDINLDSVKTLKRLLSKHFQGVIHCSDTAKEAIENSEIIITCTPGHQPVVNYDWVQKGTHINAIGADAEGKQELDLRLIQEGRVIVDDFEQASHSGEINVAYSKNLVSKDHLSTSISDVVSEKNKGRLSEDDITIFDSTGLAIQDLAVAAYVYKALTQH